jgi:hypothetical protein
MCMNIDHLVAIPIYSIGNAGGLTALEYHPFPPLSNFLLDF